MPYRPPRDRASDVQRAQELKAAGKSTQAIARELGVGRSTVSDYLNHPDSGVLYRKRQRQWQMCPDCGGKMSYGAHQCMRCRRK